MNAAADSNLIEVYNDIEMLKKVQSYVSDSRGADLLRGGRDLVGRGAGAARDTKAAEVTSGLFGKAIDAAAFYAEDAPGKDFIREKAQRVSSSMSKLLAKFTADLDDTNDRLSDAYIKINVEARNFGKNYQEPEEAKSRQTAQSNIQLANRALATALRNAY